MAKKKKMPGKGFMSPEHIEEYCLSRMLEALKEGIMNHADIFNRADMFNNPLCSKDAYREYLKSLYVLGFSDASSTVAKILEDIQKVNGVR